MIYTLTLNTSLDYVAHVDELGIGKINRSSEYNIFPGGKGINVSQVLKNLGIESIALGFIAGYTGDALKAMVEDLGIASEFVRLSKGITRVNIKLRSENSEDKLQETDINFKGPEVSADELTQLKNVLQKISEGDMLVVSGSVPPSISPEAFGDMLKCVKENGVELVADVTGDYLKEALKCKPYIVKPNEEELKEFFCADKDENVEKLAQRMKDLGAGNVLVSLGEKGALLCKSDGEIIRMESAKGKAVNTVGAGDSMVAGFIAGHILYGDDIEAMKMGVSAGSATAFSEGLATCEEIMCLFGKI